MTENDREIINKPTVLGGDITINQILELFYNMDEQLKVYGAIGTIEEFKALKEKNTKKRFNIFESHGMRQFVCGYCDRPILTTDNYCSFCGQKLDWSEE